MDIAELYASIVPRYPEFRGQVAIVTGSSRGIGKGIALRLGREGMKVVVNSRTAEAVEATTAELRNLGIDALAVTADLGETAGVDRLFDETLRAYGTVDLLVNNAAALRRSDIFSVDEAMLDLQLASNIRGPYMCSKRVAEIIRDKRAGSIIHISSVGGGRAHWKGEPYDMTKGALDALTRAMALDLGEYGVQRATRLRRGQSTHAGHIRPRATGWSRISTACRCAATARPGKSARPWPSCTPPMPLLSPDISCT